MALTDASADYMWSRYGWRYGVPAYLVAGFVGYSRVDAKNKIALEMEGRFGRTTTYAAKAGTPATSSGVYCAPCALVRFS